MSLGLVQGFIHCSDRDYDAGVVEKIDDFRVTYGKRDIQPSEIHQSIFLAHFIYHSSSIYRV